MKQEDKELLLKDLCARLPYGVMLKHISTEKPFNLFSFKRDEYVSYKEDGVELAVDGIYYDWVVNNIYHNIGTYIKPYLRPMSSMTTEEICKLENIIGGGFTYRGGTLTLNTEEIIRLPIYKISNLIQFIYSRHLDLNNLIPMGLALEAPEGMYR